MSTLFTPFQQAKIRFRNRLGMSPMCMYTAVDGQANSWHLAHYVSRAQGGAGLILMEATAVSPEGRISPGDLGLYHDNQIEPLVNINQMIHEQDCISGVQLAHAGRKAGHAKPWQGNAALYAPDWPWNRLAPSAMPFDEGEPMPRAMTEEDIDRLKTAFVDATCRARQAGFRLLEIHAAHGYLFHEFLSPLSNLRTDSYGGSFENRIRFLLQVIHAVRAEWPAEFPLWVRISASDWTSGGWSLAESIALAKRLKIEGVDLIDVSSGGNVAGAQIPIAPGYQVAFSEAIRKEAEVATATVGLITDASQAERILSDGKADVVLLGRPLLQNPYLPQSWAKELEAELPLPKQYLRGW